MKDLNNWLSAGEPAAESSGMRALSAEDAAREISAREGRSEEELMGELRSAVAQGRRDGSITDKSLQELSDKLSPMLSEEQRHRLSSIMRSLE